MRDSIVLDELRKIRDANSLRHLSQMPEENSKELRDALEWYVKAIGKPVTVVTPGENGESNVRILTAADYETE